jgi:hypothetical protein
MNSPAEAAPPETFAERDSLRGGQTAVSVRSSSLINLLGQTTDGLLYVLDFGRELFAQLRGLSPRGLCRTSGIFGSLASIFRRVT